MRRIESKYITSKQATSYFAASKFSRGHRHPLNLAVTVNFSLTACPPGEASAVMRNLIKDRFGRWLRHKSSKNPAYGAPTYTLVMEAKDGFQHAHWCVHVDDALRAEFEKKLPKWVASITGKIHDQARCIKIEDIYGIMGLARYCMKGINPYHAGRRFVQPEYQGVVYGKRVAISRSLGRASRSAQAEAEQAVQPADGAGLTKRTRRQREVHGHRQVQRVPVTAIAPIIVTDRNAPDNERLVPF